MQLYHNMNNTRFQVKCQYQVKCQCMRRSFNSICLHTNTTKECNKPYQMLFTPGRGRQRWPAMAICKNQPAQFQDVAYHRWPLTSIELSHDEFRFEESEIDQYQCQEIRDELTVEGVRNRPMPASVNPWWIGVRAIICKGRQSEITTKAPAEATYYDTRTSVHAPTYY